MLEARTVGAALQHARSDNARDVINFNKRTNDHFQLSMGRGGRARREGCGARRRTVVEQLS